MGVNSEGYARLLSRVKQSKVTDGTHPPLNEQDAMVRGLIDIIDQANRRLVLLSEQIDSELDTMRIVRMRIEQGELDKTLHLANMEFVRCVRQTAVPE